MARIQRLGFKARKLVLDGDQYRITLHAMAIATIVKELDEFMDSLPEHMKSNCELITIRSN